MATTILTHNSATTTTEPANLAQGELAVNTTDQKLWVGDGTATPVPLVVPSAGGVLPDGLADGNTMRWEDSTSTWDATSDLVVLDVGDVGIGTSNVTTAAGFVTLAVGSEGADYGQLELRGAASTAGAFWGDATSINVQASGVRDVAFLTSSNSERMRIKDDTGNVGIGVATPTANLHVDGGASNGIIRLTNDLTGTTGTDGLEIGHTDVNTYFWSYEDSTMQFVTNNLEAMRIQRTSLFVGIGGIPTSPLHVQTAVAQPNSTIARFQRSSNSNALIEVFGDGGKITYLGAANQEGFIESEGDMGYYADDAAGEHTWYNTGGFTQRMQINGTGGLILSGSVAQKATGTTWSNPSDVRLKDNITDYTKGSAELMQIKVREWEFNGKGSSVAGSKGLGVIADEIMQVLPDTVSTTPGKLNPDDEEDTDIKEVDADEVIWLLVATVQELTARLEVLEA